MNAEFRDEMEYVSYLWYATEPDPNTLTPATSAAAARWWRALCVSHAVLNRIKEQYR